MSLTASEADEMLLGIPLEDFCSLFSKPSWHHLVSSTYKTEPWVLSILLGVHLFPCTEAWPIVGEKLQVICFVSFTASFRVLCNPYIITQLSQQVMLLYENNPAEPNAHSVEKLVCPFHSIHHDSVSGLFGTRSLSRLGVVPGIFGVAYIALQHYMYK